MDGFTFYDAREAPFSLHGIARRAAYARLPEALLPSLRPPIQRLARCTAGARVRFAASAREVILRITLDGTHFKTHMTPLNMAGAELYAGAGATVRRVDVLRPTATGDVPFEKLDGYALKPVIEKRIALSGEPETYTLYLPAFMGVERVQVGLPEGCAPRAAEGYSIPRPIAFYGSSITQGACACRPSLSYPARVCAALDADFVNLGFAGNALGDLEIARYIATLEMSAFVLDYDHNAPDEGFLRATHKPFFDAVREKNPELPILILSRPDDGRHRARTDACFDVIQDTWRAAVAAGDARVALLDGRTFYPPGERDQCLTDLVHPNDHGFFRIAERVLPALRALLRLES